MFEGFEAKRSEGAAGVCSSIVMLMLIRMIASVFERLHGKDAEDMLLCLETCSLQETPSKLRHAWDNKLQIIGFNS